MRATIMHKVHDVRIENIPDAAIREPTDALIRVTRACICGSDLWPYNDMEETPRGRPMGHEAVGVVEDVGSDVHHIRRGQLVRLSIAAANRDPAIFEAPDEFDLHRPRPRRHLAFAQGPHVCVGVHLARLEARVAIAALLAGLRGLRLDPRQRTEITGLVFRKPAASQIPELMGDDIGLEEK